MTSGLSDDGTSADGELAMTGTDAVGTYAGLGVLALTLAAVGYILWRRSRQLMID